MDEWVVKYQPVHDRFWSDMKETIRYVDHRANQIQQPMQVENSGALGDQSFVIPWIEQDGTQNMLAKIKCTWSYDATLCEKFHLLTEAVCSVAAFVWYDSFGRKKKVSKVQSIECCSDLNKEDEEYFLVFERLSATHKQYRGDGTLLNREGRILARWEGIIGDRFIH